MALDLPEYNTFILRTGQHCFKSCLIALVYESATLTSL